MKPPRIPESWESVFANVAKSIAKRSKDPNTQVGAVVVSPDNIIIATGFNGPPASINDDAIDWSRGTTQLEGKYPWIKHAEDNALWFAALSRGWVGLAGCSIHVTGFPCPSCMLSIVRAKLASVYVIPMEIGMMQADVIDVSQKIAFEGNVKVYVEWGLK